jgi:hypothetical protein
VDLLPKERSANSRPWLNPAKQNQDQENDNDKAETAATVIPGAVEWSAAKSAETSKQDEDENDYQDSAERHEMISQEPRLRRGLLFNVKTAQAK